LEFDKGLIQVVFLQCVFKPLIFIDGRLNKYHYFPADILFGVIISVRKELEKRIYTLQVKFNNLLMDTL